MTVNIKRKRPIIKSKLPLIKPKTPEVLIRYLACLGIQSFYRRFVKWERDPQGLPIDPITREGIPPHQVIRIIYQTMEASPNPMAKPKIRSRVQIFDIEILWQAITKANKRVAINPLTNTRFSRIQFQKILNRAVAQDLIKSSELQKYRLRYAPGFRSDRFTSQYEVNEINLIKMAASQLLLQLRNYLLEAAGLLPPAFAPAPTLAPTLAPATVTSTALTPPTTPTATDPTTKFIRLLNSKINKWDGCFYNLDTYQSAPLELLQLAPYLKRTTLVQIATALGNYPALVALLELGAEISLPYPDYIYPIQICLIAGHFEMIEPLLLYGGRHQLEWQSPMGTAIELAHTLVSDVPNIFQLLLA